MVWIKVWMSDCMGVGHVSIYMDLGVHMPVCTPGCAYVSECVKSLGLPGLFLQDWVYPRTLLHTSAALCRWLKLFHSETSLAIQSLTLHASNTGGAGSIPGWELGSCMLFGAAKRWRRKQNQKQYPFHCLYAVVVYIKPSTPNAFRASLPSVLQ